MTELYTLDLGRFGQLTVLERSDPHTGAVRFNITGRRAAGALLFIPHAADDEAIPRQLRIEYGDGDRWLAAHRTNKPQFNGVQLEGGAILNPDAADGLQWRLNLRRPGGGWHQHSQYPQRSAEYATAAIGALIGHWRTHPQHEDLVLAAARSAADRRISELLDCQIRPRSAQVAALTAEIDRAYALVEHLRQPT